MQLNIGTSMRAELSQVISPRMIQSMEILQLAVMALQERIEHELQENPVLELKEDGPEEGAPVTEEEIEAQPPANLDEQAIERVADPQKELVIDDKGGNEQDFD